MDFKKWYWNEFGGSWDELDDIHREAIKTAYQTGTRDGYDQGYEVGYADGKEADEDY